MARRPCVVEEPRHAETQHAREPGDLQVVSGHPDRDRVVKATCRTAAMDGREESDCPVVPVNRLHKGEGSSAEVGEERVQTTENIAHARTHPTQRGDMRVPGSARCAAPPCFAASYPR